MNKKILTLLTSSILLLSSCESALDISPEGRKDLDEIFSSEVTTGAYLNGCYQEFPQFGLGYYFGLVLQRHYLIMHGNIIRSLLCV